MTIEVLLLSAHDDPAQWRDRLQALVPDLRLHTWPDCENPASIDVALAWKPPPGVLASLPNLKLIQCLGMGVDALFADPRLPTNVPLARLYDPDLIEQMSQYVCWAVLNFHRRFDDYAQYQRRHEWTPLPATDASLCRVGILGLGAIGTDCALKLAALGFDVAGWSRTPKPQREPLAAIRCYHGAEGLTQMVSGAMGLICLLPLTPDTEGIIDAALLARLARGALVVNVARGAHVVADDLLAALNTGQVSTAVLDVFDEEPLGHEHPFWDHPQVRVTPHIAGLTRPETAAAIVAENIRRVMSGEAPRYQVGHERQY